MLTCLRLSVQSYGHRPGFATLEPIESGVATCVAAKRGASRHIVGPIGIFVDTRCIPLLSLVGSAAALRVRMVSVVVGR